MIGERRQCIMYCNAARVGLLNQVRTTANKEGSVNGMKNTTTGAVPWRGVEFTVSLMCVVAVC
jgi:hypothetical protein